jgi:DNA-binding PadR family transcriptional regulator
MSLTHAVLGLLDASPASGYELTKWFTVSLQRYAWSAQQSHIYPELKRLERDGDVTIAERGPRGRQTYAITPKGKELLQAWLRTPARDSVRDERVLRMFLLSSLDPAEARVIILQYAHEAEKELEALRAVIATSYQDCDSMEFGRLAAEYGLYHYQALADWASWALKRIDDTIEEYSA